MGAKCKAGGSTSYQEHEALTRCQPSWRLVPGPKPLGRRHEQYPGVRK